MSVNYRAILQIEGEPYIMFFLSCLLYILLVAENNFEPNVNLVVNWG